MTAASRGDYFSRLPRCPDCGSILDDAPRTPDRHVECPQCRRVHHPSEVYPDGA